MSPQWSYCVWDKKQPRTLRGCNARSNQHQVIWVFFFGGGVGKQPKVAVDDCTENYEPTSLVCKHGWMFTTEHVSAVYICFNPKRGLIFPLGSSWNIISTSIWLCLLALVFVFIFIFLAFLVKVPTVYATSYYLIPIIIYESYSRKTNQLYLST